MKPAKTLVLFLALASPAALYAQRGGETQTRGELRVGTPRGSTRGEIRREVVNPALPVYSVPIFPYYPYAPTLTTPPGFSTYYLPPSGTIPPAVEVPTPQNAPSSEDVQALTSQIQALAAEVRRLEQTQQRSQVSSSVQQSTVSVPQAVPQPVPPRAQIIAPAPEPPPPLPSTTLVFRDNHRVEVQNYAIIEQTLRVMDKDNSARIALSDLDLDATRSTNQGKGVRFAVPGQ